MVPFCRSPWALRKPHQILAIYMGNVFIHSETGYDFGPKKHRDHVVLRARLETPNLKFEFFQNESFYCSFGCLMPTKPGISKSNGHRGLNWWTSLTSMYANEFLMLYTKKGIEGSAKDLTECSGTLVLKKWAKLVKLCPLISRTQIDEKSEVKKRGNLSSFGGFKIRLIKITKN